jgi:glutathione peroxidase
MGQEPGSEEEIQTFCRTTYGIDFPMTAKVDVKDAEAHPFYKWAAGELGEPAVPVWNFHKILVGKDGKALQAFGPRTEPQDPGLVAAIEAAL